MISCLMLSHFLVFTSQNGDVVRRLRRRKFLPGNDNQSHNRILRLRRKRPIQQNFRDKTSLEDEKTIMGSSSNGVDILPFEKLVNIDRAVVDRVDNVDRVVVDKVDNVDNSNQGRRIKVLRRKGDQNPVKKLLVHRKNFENMQPLLTSTTTTTERPLLINGQPANRTQEDSRFLSIFTIVSFKNDVCTSGTGTNGTCYSSADCSRLAGTASGTCASGFGVCCLFTKTCGDTTSNNCTYFQNSAYPSTFNAVGSCQLTVNKCNDNVCQLRLDFNNLVLSQPGATDQVCTTDQLIISGGQPIPAICGTNNGQHVYVDMGLASNNPVTLTVVTSGTSFARSFSIRVCQIECSSLSKAPDGCLQYYTGVSGQLQTFNYNSGSGLQLSNTDYTMCVRMERNFCGIQYTTCPDTVNTPSMAFSITGGSPMLGSVVGTNCATDWITIPCATNTMDPTAQTGTPSTCVDRICGMVFNSVTAASTTSPTSVYSFVRPFQIFVHTDEFESGNSPNNDFGNRGFCLEYMQVPCNSSTGK